jgi:glycosyltransferase involved in cell wall biosynthesis
MADSISGGVALSRAAPRTRVVVVSSVHRWNDTRIFMRQAASLAASGYEVTLIGIGDRREPFDSAGVHVYNLPRRRRALRWITDLEIVRRVLALDASIVHAHDPELFPFILLLRLLGRKAVCDVHEDVPAQVLNKEWVPRPLRRPLSFSLRRCQRWLPSLADAVILAEDSYRRSFPAVRNVEVVRNYPLLPEQCKCDYASDRLRLVYVGDVRMVRGIGEYVRIVHRLRQDSIPAELHVVGSFADPAEEAEIRERIRVLELDEHVKFLGRRPPEEIPALVEACDVGLALLHPIGNYRESYPTKMFEYMAAGLPVVVSRFALWEKVVEGNECGCVVDPLDVEEAAAAIARYWSSPELRERHGRNGRAAAVARYHWNRELPRLVAVYASLSAEDGRKH